MTEKNGADILRRRSLPIDQWHEMGQAGDMIPVTIPLAGDSMRPLIRRNRDKVTIIPLNRELQIGDIVLFQGGPERYVVHRVYRIREGFVQTLGDNCLNPDPWMKKEQVWGLVIRMERGGKTYPLDSEASRRWGRAWMAIHPIRMIYRRGRALAGKVYRKVFPKGRKGGGVHG